MVVETGGHQPDGAEVSLTEVHNRLRQMIDDCQDRPIIVKKHGRRRAALVSIDFYEAALMAFKDRG